MIHFTFFGTRHSFVSPEGFSFSENSAPQIKKAITVTRIFSPSIWFATIFNKRR